MKKVPVGDFWLKIAATETMKTWETKTEKDLDFQMISDCSDEHVDISSYHVCWETHDWWNLVMQGFSFGWGDSGNCNVRR